MQVLSELLFINVEVGTVPREHIPLFIQQLKNAIKAQFDDDYEFPPKIVFVPTYNGAYKCTLAGPSEVIKVINCDGKTIDLPMDELMTLYTEQIMDQAEEDDYE